MTSGRVRSDCELRDWLRENSVEVGECWMWRGDPGHYGTITRRGRRWLTHRLSYTLFVGDIPDGMMVLHDCDTPGCVNPDHLRLGTHRDNMTDRADRGRVWNGRCGEANPMSKLSEASVQRIRLLLRRGMPGVAIAAQLGVSPTTISHIKSGKRWSATEQTG